MTYAGSGNLAGPVNLSSTTSERTGACWWARACLGPPKLRDGPSNQAGAVSAAQSSAATSGWSGKVKLPWNSSMKAKPASSVIIP
jgi:hypothetical protein